MPEMLEGGAELMQDIAQIVPEQTDRGAGTQDFDAAQAGERPGEPGDGRLVKRVGRRVQRHRDHGFRGRDQVHRQALLLEYLECIGQKTHLMPHARAFHRN